MFAWLMVEMPSISYSVICHFLNVNHLVRLIKQKKRKFTSNRVEVVKHKIEKFLKADFIQEVYYSDWLSNAMMVKKVNEKWRMCGFHETRFVLRIVFHYLQSTDSWMPQPDTMC